MVGLARVLRDVGMPRWLICLLCAGCLHSSATTCGDGTVCPVGLTCVDTEHTTPGSALCASGTCGDGVRDPDEACDDGNNRSGDGCPADCTPPCGDGVLDPGEACDDGNTIDGDDCSADCRSVERRFTARPATVELTASEAGPLPAAVVEVALEELGDTVVINDPGASWLNVGLGDAHTDGIALKLSATDSVVIGMRMATIHLTLQHLNSTSTETLELPVTYTVQPSDLGITIMPSSFVFTVAVGDLDVPPQSIDIAFNGELPAATSAADWLTAVRSGPTTYDLVIADTTFPAGTTLSGEVVFAASRDGQLVHATAHVDCHVVAPPVLSISTAPAALALRAVADGALPEPEPVTVTFTGARVQLVDSPSWLAVSPVSSSPASPASFTIAATSTQFPAGTIHGEVVFRTVREDNFADVAVHVDYLLQ